MHNFHRGLLLVIVVLQLCGPTTAFSDSVRLTLTPLAGTQVPHFGMNFEGFSKTEGTLVFTKVLEEMLEQNDPEVVRFGFPWNPSTVTQERVRTLKLAGRQIWLTLWDLPNALVTSPRAKSKRKAKDWPLVAREIASKLADLKVKTGYEIDFFSVNEPVLTASNTGGYNLLLSPVEQLEFLRELDRYLADSKLSTKLVIGLHKFDQDSLSYLQEMLSHGPLPARVVAADAHSYWLHKNRNTNAEAWTRLLGASNLELWCGEWESETRLWLNPNRSQWSPNVGDVAQIAVLLVNQFGVSRLLPWYQGVLKDYPSRTVYLALRSLSKWAPTGTVFKMENLPRTVQGIAFGSAAGRVGVFLHSRDMNTISIELPWVDGTAHVSHVTSSGTKSEVLAMASVISVQITRNEVMTIEYAP